MAMDTTTTTEPLRLNLGAGACPIPGYVNLDIKTGTPIDALPYEDGTVDEIRASHVLEHVSHTMTLDVLKHWHAKLRPGGTLKVCVPDIQYIVDRMKEASAEPLEGYLMGGHQDEHDVHKAVFSEGKLHAQLSLAGFDTIERFDSDHQDCSALPVSLNMRARKADSELMTDTVMLMSMARYAFTANMVSVLKAVHELRMGYVAATGCFWGQCLTRIMETTIRENPRCKWLLTCDFDTVFEPDQIRAMRRLADDNNLDAVFPVQSKRDTTTALLTAVDDCGNMIEKLDYGMSRRQLMRCRTGHFGLTLIRVEALAKLQKPWFLETPDKDGGWGDGHVDPDIHFWNQWNAAGLSLWQANRIKVGHAQQVITWPDHAWASRHQYFNEWERDGIPHWAR